MNFKTLQKFKTNKHKRKSLKGKKMKLGNIPQIVLVFVSPTSYKNKNKEYIRKNLKQDIGVSNTAFSKNQAWKQDFKHNSIFSSLRKHFFTHTCCKVEWTQIRSFYLVLGSFILHQRRKCASPRPLKQMINGFFLLKISKLCFIN
jgi:hypothetical protein